MLNQFGERLVLGLAIGLYLVFGTYHLTQFETTDEHFWKYERIPQYWEALKTGNLKKTAINDKPGVTVALISGSGLLFADPANHRVRDETATQHDALTIYNAAYTSSLNLALRLPILLFNGLLLLVGFFLLKQIFQHSLVPLLTTILTALSPALLGISQVVNPDALLWSCGWISFLSVLAYLRTTRWLFIVLAGVFTGLALLSKYTANVLFPLELALLFTYPLFNTHWQEKFSSIAKYLQSLVKAFITITLLAATTFSLGMPAVFKKPEKFWDGMFGFWHTMHIDIIIYGLLLLLAFDGFIFQGRFSEKGIALWKKYFLPWCHWSLLIPLLFYGSIVLLSLGNQSFLPLNEFQSTAKENGELAFPLLNQYPPILESGIKLLVAAYPLVVSIHPLLWFILLFSWVILFTRHQVTPLHLWLTVFLSWFSLAYFAAALGADVLTNVRYSILLFPLLALLTAISTEVIFVSWEIRSQKILPYLLPGCFLLLLSFSLFSIKPFYLNYTSPLVGKQFAPHDAWGYGQYEAAQFLNNLPNKDSLLIWSDRNGICQFFTGPKCISGYKIDLEKIKPDYFVVSKRGVERGYVPREKITGAPLFEFGTLIPQAVWRLDILDRPANFILIAPSHY